jgi:hypothetical protein
MNSKFDIEKIFVGDNIYFESTNAQSNHDEYWEVTGKSNHDVFVKFDKYGHDETWSVPISKVLYLEEVSKLRK